MKLRWLVPLILTASALLGWSGLVPDPAKPVRPKALPVIAPTDGLPETLVAYQKYTVTFQVTFPEDWPIENRGGNDRSTRAMLMAFVSRGFRDGRLGNPEISGMPILDSRGEMNAAGATFTWSCELLTPSPGLLTVRLQASEPGGLFEPIDGSSGLRVASRDFQHTVIAPGSDVHIAR